MLKTGQFRKQIRNNWRILKCGEISWTDYVKKKQQSIELRRDGMSYKQ
jgi:hypothetical protein